MHPRDEPHYRRFAAVARSLGRSLEQHYAALQAEQRDAGGAALALAPHERRGLDIALRHIVPGQRILVLGCGAGAEIAYLKAAGHDAITGVDISPRLAALTAQRHGVATLAADFAHTGLQDRSFDVVLCHRALHHLLYPFAALEEMARLARLTVAIVDEPARSWLKGAVRRLGQGLEHGLVHGLVHGLGPAPALGSDGVHEYQFAWADVARYMGLNGFAPIGQRRYWETRHRPANFFGNLLARPAGNRFVGVFQRLKVMA